MAAIDIVMLTHDRLEHLVATVEALRERTPEPYRLTVVDNASGPEVRSWLGEHRDLFARIIPRPTDEHLPGFQHGIDATTSDPLIVTDPDLVVPELRPSWLAQMLELADRHPDFGVIGVDLDRSNFPPDLDEAAIETLREPGEVLEGGRLIEGNVGTHFMVIRRSALQPPFVTDIDTCRNARARGYRTGVATAIKALHLGFDDHERYPEYVREKDARGAFYPDYRTVLDRVRQAPALESLAEAGPVVRVTRGAGILDSAILELAWGVPVVGDSVPGVVTLQSPEFPLPLGDDSAQAVVIGHPPTDLLPKAIADTARVAARMVVLRSTIEAVGAELADGLAPEGWRGRELWAAGEIPLELARYADAELGDRLGLGVVERGEDWLNFFAAGGFSSGERRLFVFEPERPRPAPERVLIDHETVSDLAPPTTAQSRYQGARPSSEHGWFRGLSARLRRVNPGARLSSRRSLRPPR